MSEVCVYIAVSLDGFIATEEGGVGWLDAFIGAELVGHTVYANGVVRLFYQLGR